MNVERDVYVPVRDGTHLAVDLWRPDARDTGQAVLVLTPYGKGGVSPTTLVEAGFVVAVADARGTGCSEGPYDYYALEEGPFDGYDLVEWVAAQEWSDGNVGMSGTSAMAVGAYATALTQPPHLRAIAANMHPGDFYFDQWRVGGVFRWENRIWWAAGMDALTGPVHPGESSAPGYERKRRVYEERLERHLAGLGGRPRGAWLRDLYERRTYDEYWQRHSFVRRAGDIRVPVLHGGVWFDHFIRGTLTCHEAIEVPKRLVVQPGALKSPGAVSDGGFAALEVAWFEHFLRGVDNGVTDGPMARLYIMGRDEYVDEPSWPVPTDDTRLFLHAGGRLVLDRADGGQPSELVHDPANPNPTPPDPGDQRGFEGRCLTFTSPPLAADVEVIGTPRLVLHARPDAPDVDVCVRLCDVDEAGWSRLLNTGALKGSHVASHVTPSDLVAGEDYRFDVEIWPVANVFRRGHRIRVAVSASDFPFFEVNPLPSRTLVLHDRDHASQLVLPVPRRAQATGITFTM